MTGNGINDASSPISISDGTGNAPGTHLFSQTFISRNGSFPAASQLNGQNYRFIASYVVDLGCAGLSALLRHQRAR
jgi:hypothetical protein